MCIPVRLCQCLNELAAHLREALEQRLGAIGDADMMEMLAAVARLRVSPVHFLEPRTLYTCPSRLQALICLLLSLSAASCYEVNFHMLLLLVPFLIRDTVWHRVMTRMQAAQKQGARPQDAAPSSTAKAPVEKEFGADLEFHALRLSSMQEEATLDPQSGFQGLGTHERCSIPLFCSPLWRGTWCHADHPIKLCASFYVRGGGM